MTFTSSVFAAFFAVLYVLYLLSMRRLRLQNVLLLVGSYFFYGWWDWRFLGLIWLSTLIDFVCGRALDRRRADCPVNDSPADEAPYAYSARRRRGILAVSVAANLGILGFFKYFDFFSASCAELLAAIGLPLQPRLLNLVLPIGISFYTFQTLSYTIDIYRGQLRAHKSLLNFAVFVAFFPQLVAGPILRAREFLPQVSRPRTLDLNRIYCSGYLILWGLFKKLVIADNLATLVDGVFNGPAPPHYGGAVLVAVYAFAIQIYCDFSGYTDIARGCAGMMGFDLPLNFNLPYFATNPVEFWRRWHISLSSWLRDYVYVPFGGNRKGPRRTCLNLMLTMVLGGLWHGAAWTFVLWGVYQAVLLIGYKAIAAWTSLRDRQRSERFSSIRRWVARGVFFHLVCLGWLIFRANSVEQIGQMLGAIFTPWPWWIICGANTVRGTGIVTVAGYGLVLVLMQLAQYAKRDLNIVIRMPALARGLAYTAMFYGLVCFGVDGDSPFIYFQF